MKNVTHLLSVQNSLGEGPRWHPQEAALYWVDIERGEIHTLSWHDRLHTVHALGVAIGCLGFRKGGGLVLATSEGFGTWSKEEGLVLWIDPRQLKHEGRFNDGAVDRQGRFWAGTMTPTGSENCLYRLNSDGSVAQMETGIAIANGMGWSPKGDVFYFTDSPKKTIYAYDFDSEEGRLSNRRVWVHTPDEPGVPDGLAVDQEGCVWSARWDGWKVDRYDPQGRHMLEIRLPCQRPTSCVFGGEDLSTLILTSARVGLDKDLLDIQPQAGDLFFYDTETQGMETSFFAG